MRLISILLIFTFLNAQKINLNFDNLDINTFIKMVSKITNKNILLTDELRGKVNFISVKPIDKKDIYSILLNILKSKGYTIVSEKGFLKVVRSRDALREAPPLNSNLNQIQTNIISLKNIDVDSAYLQINFLLSRYGKIIKNRNKNLLIITDYPDNLKTIKTLLNKLDKANVKKTKFIKLKKANVKNIFEKIETISKNLFNTKIHPYTLLKDENTNSIIIISSDFVINKLIPIINSFDYTPKPLSQVTNIIPIKNSDVTNLSQLLSKIINDKYKKNKPTITADKETNSLILVGSDLQINTLKNIIYALDIPKEQVYVKLRVLEISNKKASSIGIKYGLVGGVANSSGLYSMSASLGGPAVAFDVTKLGLTAPTVQKGLALGVTLDLLEGEGAAKKLSEPSILAINNTESTIYVGKTESIITQSTVGASTTDLTKNTYSRQDIGLTLNVKPRIDNDNKVSLHLKAILEDILPGSQVGLPTTTKRNIDTTTIVNNGQSIIIGGLVRDNKSFSISKVPLLGDIPYLGALFRHKQTNIDKTTLVIVVTPYIVKNPQELSTLRNTLSKLDKLEKQFVYKVIKK